MLKKLTRINLATILIGEVLSIIFAILKLCGVIDWDWKIVFIPFMMIGIVILLSILVWCIAALVDSDIYDDD